MKKGKQVQELSEYEFVQWMLFATAEMIQKRIEGIGRELANVILGFVALVALALLAWLGFTHPRWVLYVVLAIATLWTLLVTYGTLRVMRLLWRPYQRTRMARYRILLHRCLFEGECPNKRTRYHLARNRVIWGSYQLFGYPSLWVFHSAIVYPRQFVSIFWYLTYKQFRKKPQATV